MAKILIVEDDYNLSQTLMNLLNRRHEAYYAADVEEAKHKANLYTFDLVIIDRNLPDGDGLDLIDFFNQHTYPTRTLVLTQKSTLAHKIEGLENGADEYLPKPFDYDELNLRITHLLKIRKTKIETIHQCGSISLHVESHCLKIEDQEWILRKKEVQLMSYFLERLNQVVTREDLLYAIWSPEGKSDINLRTIDVNLRRLRLRLGAHRHLLKSIRGIGYRLSY